MAELACPNCGKAIVSYLPSSKQMPECTGCWLRGPRDVLEKLGRRLAAYEPRERNEGRVCGLCKADMAMPGSRLSHDCPVPLRAEIARLKSAESAAATMFAVLGRAKYVASDEWIDEALSARAAYAALVQGRTQQEEG